MEKEKFGVSWALTTACNYKCSYCYRYCRDKIVSEEKGRRLIDHLFIMGCRKISLAGGEPFLWHSKQAVLDLLMYIKSKGMVTEVITNGSYLTETDIAKIADYLDILTIDIDCLDPIVQTKLGRPKNHISHSLRLFDEAKKQGVLIKTNSVATALNMHLVEEMTDFIRYNGFYKWKIYQFMPVIGLSDKANDLIVNQKDFNVLEKTITKNMVGSSTKLVIENNEQMSNSYVNISPSGIVHTNEIYKDGLLLNLEIGNIFDMDIEDIYNHYSFDKDKFLKYHTVTENFLKEAV
jgi:MoaA/NifB/PqqE/SkfB family radical SAM enzyme